MNLDHDAELVRIWPELSRFAKAGPGAEQHHILTSGWKVWLLVDMTTHQRTFGFRCFNDRKISWYDFLDECRRLAKLVRPKGPEWQLTGSERRSFFEVTFTQPLEERPATPPPEAA